MQNRQNGRRRRGGGGNNPRPMGQPMGGQSANRLEVRVRGNAHQLLEKYKQLARDAHQAGDRVASEYYLQHADHYFRVLNDSRIRQEEMRARRGVFDQFEDEPTGAEGMDSGEEGETSGREQPERGERQERPERQDRQDRQDRGERGERRERNADGERRERNADGERPRRWEDRRGDRNREPRAESREDAPAADADVLELRLSDGEAALVAFGGVPARDAAPAPAAESEDDAPKPRRRGRPRKATEAVDG
jgi:hypothetical protein